MSTKSKSPQGKYKEWNLKDLKPAVYNPNKISKTDYEQLKNSIKKFGPVQPIVVNTRRGRFGVIIGGHHRQKAAIELEMETYPCYEVSLDLKSEKELNLRLNRNKGDFDLELLKKFERQLLLESGFNFKEINSIFKNKKEIERLDKLQDMELQPYESHDYIVLIFKNSFDWMKALQKLGVSDVNYSLVKEKKKIGLGRVVDGAKVLQKIPDKKTRSK